MPYHDTFYTAQNIIGYTGALHDFPTVYFRCDRRNLIGRITQRHPYPQNVGRNRPSTSIGYTMGNEMTANGMRLVERHPNGRTHTSRNIFHSIETGQTGQRHGGNIAEIANSLKTLAILAQADNAPGVLSGDLFAQVRGPIEAIDRMPNPSVAPTTLPKPSPIASTSGSRCCLSCQLSRVDDSQHREILGPVAGK